MWRCTGHLLFVPWPSVSGCSFLVANFLVDEPQVQSANAFQKLRGPDATTHVESDGWFVLHNLLHITGNLTKQPFVSLRRERRALAVFNGEVYNYQDLFPGRRFPSDGNAILPAYWKWGEGFGEKLDGEFAIAILDFSAQKLLLLTDPLGTKPLFFGYTASGRFAAASYRSALIGIGITWPETFMADPNTLYVATFSELRHFAAHVDKEPISTAALESMTATSACGPLERVCGDDTSRIPAPPFWPFRRRFPVFRWDLRQYKKSTEDWISAFQRAVAKRVRGLSRPSFIGLSSGYDSGAIHLALSLAQAPHRVFTIRAFENMTVLNRRLRIGGQSKAERVGVSNTKFLSYLSWLEDHAEPAHYATTNETGYSVLKDQAATALAFILERAAQLDMRVHLSGHGGDETISLYHVERIHEFPEDLETFFPWPAFYFGTMRDYLAKEETVAGAFGIESRYPFLDRDVVQEFLALDASVKNSRYKRPIHDFFVRHGYAFQERVKQPFLFFNMLG